eukprot:TRINITY_DN17485_c0_g1_i1.p1 TRINITY_DN17485_c0_g1~~TRINITY_DN17485_c0_g1_i1.p1  ORF type:complete len:428 (-),score=84.95 TRINITY_DN17485_c0_g1_i1:120-1403(-)
MELPKLSSGSGGVATAFLLQLLAAALRVHSAGAASELPLEPFPERGGEGPDSYFADATLTSCTAIDPYPALASLPVTPTVEEAKAFCSSSSICGGFVYTTSQASQAGGGPPLAAATYCKPGTMIAGTATASSAIAYERRLYRHCDVRVTLPTSTSTFYGTVTGTRKACVTVNRGLTPARARTPLPAATRRQPQPKREVTSGGVSYVVGKDVFISPDDAQALSADGSSTHVMTSDGVSYHMFGASHGAREQYRPAIALDGYYPLYTTLEAAQAASIRGGGNGQAFEVGPASALQAPTRWSLAPHAQTYFMPTDGEKLFHGNYVAPFAFDGYFPLYLAVGDAQLASSDGSVQSHGPGSDTGHPMFWSDGQMRIFYMPAAGPERFYGTYRAAATGPYETRPARAELGGPGTPVAAAAAQAVAAAALAAED